MTTVLETYIENRKRIQPNDANNYDTAHGGVVMKAMDEIGAMSAMRVAGRPCVTAGVDELSFKRPIPVGDAARIVSFAYDTGRTSVEVRVRADREVPTTGETERTSESCFTFVAIDEDGRPTEVPELTVDSERGEQLRQEGLSAAGEERD